MTIRERLVGDEVVQMLLPDATFEDEAGKVVDKIELDVDHGMDLVESILLRSSGKPYTIRKRD